MIFFPIGFVLFWIGLMFLFSKISGWGRLSEAYHFNHRDNLQWGVSQDNGVRTGIHRFKMNHTTYKSGVQACITEDAFHLKMSLLLRPFHPPIRIPWRQLMVKKESHKIFGFTVETFTLIPQKGDVTISFPGKYNDAFSSYITPVSSD